MENQQLRSDEEYILHDQGIDTHMDKDCSDK
jgi:hypothetical protein